MMRFFGFRTMYSAFFVIVCSLAPVVSPNSRFSDCTSTREYFLSRAIGLSHIVPDNPSYDSNMQICYNGATQPSKTSCCTHQMEKRYMISAKKTFRHALIATNAYLTNIFHSHTKQYKEYFHDLIRFAENRTISLFTEVYGIKSWDRLDPLVGLYRDLHHYINFKEVNLIETVDKFFDSLFPAIFHKIMNDPPTTHYIASYVECLSSERQSLSPSPFGDYPNKISALLTRSMWTARTLLDTLKLGTEVVNTTQHLTPDPSCAKALTRMQYCSHCAGHIFFKPCTNFCLNVMRGCLARVQEFDLPWNRMLDAVARLTDKMKKSHSIETTLRTLDSRISEAVLHAIDVGPRIYSQVIHKCGHPKVSTNRNPTHHRPSASHTSHSLGTDTLDLHKRFEVFTKNVMSSKRFFHNLADLVCSQESYYDVSKNIHCWNGETLAAYTKPVTPVNLNEQLVNNPEVKVTKRNQQVTSLTQKLEENTKRLERSAPSELPQSDQADRPLQIYDPYLAEEPSRELGSTPLYQDDEDYMDGSGSGSGQMGYNIKPPRKTSSSQPPSVSTTSNELDQSEKGQDFYEDSTKDSVALSAGGVGQSSREGDTSGATTLHRTILALIPPLMVTLLNG